jgi:TP901 family phage tail tape measure protein
MAENKTVQRTVKLYIDDKEIDNSVNSIKGEVRKMTAELNKMTVGSEEYNAQMKKIGQLSSILDKHKSDLRNVGKEIDSNNSKVKEHGNIWSKAADGFNKYAGVFASAMATITGVVLSYNKMRAAARDEESSAANLKALTGLDNSSIDWLKKQAVLLSTTMDKSKLRIQADAKDILEAYMLVGSAKPELLSNKEALNAVTIEAMRMATAAKMPVKDAVDGLTLAMNQYGASANEANKYVNVLAAGSKYGSSAIQSETISITKAGVAASTAKIPIEALVGSIELLGEKGIKDEVAGTGLKTFFLKLEAGAKETRPSVVGLSTALHRLAAQNLDASTMVKRFGLESYTVAQAMISNADKVDYYTKAVTNTNVATEQAAINSDTAEAKLAQMKNEMQQVGIELANDLSPAMNVTLGVIQRMVRSIPILIDWLVKNKSNIVALTVVIGLYTLAVKASVIESKTKALWIAAENNLLAISILRHAVLNGTMTKTVAIQKLFNDVLKMNPYLLAATALAAITIALIKFTGQTTAATQALHDIHDAQKKADEDIVKEKTDIMTLVAQIKSQTTSENEKSEALKNLNGKLMDAHLNNISREDILTGRANKTISQYLGLMKQRILTQIYQEKITASLQKEIKLREKLKNLGDGTTDDAEGFAASARADLTRQIKREQQYQNQMMSQISGGSNGKASFTVYDPGHPSKPKKETQQTQYGDPATAAKQAKAAASAASKAETAEHKRMVAELNRIDADYLQQQNLLKRKYMNSSTMSQQEYEDELEKIEMNALDKKLAVAHLEPKQRQEISQKILDAQVKLKDKIKDMMKIEEVDQKDILQSELSDNKKKYNDELTLLDYALKKKIIKQKDYDDALAKITSDFNRKNQKSREKDADYQADIAEKGYNKITVANRKARIKDNLTDAQFEKKNKDSRKKFLADLLKNENLSAEKRSEIQEQYDNDELDEQEASLKQKQELQTQYNQILQDGIVQMGTIVGEQIGKLLKDGTIDFKEFLRNILSLIIDSLEKAILAARAASLARNLSELGWAGIAKWGLETAAMTAAFELAKAAVQNFYDGGFTPGGRWDQPQGIVHSNEFVANRFATSNPNLLPVLNLMDAAQRSGSVANLTADDVSSVLPASSKVAATTSNVFNNNSNSSDGALLSLLLQVNKTMQLVKSRFDEPIVAETYATGKHGTIAATDLVNKMKNNVTRQ